MSSVFQIPWNVLLSPRDSCRMKGKKEASGSSWEACNGVAWPSAAGGAPQGRGPVPAHPLLTQPQLLPGVLSTQGGWDGPEGPCGSASCACCQLTRPPSSPPTLPRDRCCLWPLGHARSLCATRALWASQASGSSGLGREASEPRCHQLPLCLEAPLLPPLWTSFPGSEEEGERQ